MLNAELTVEGAQVLRPRAAASAEPGAPAEPAAPLSLAMDAADANAIAEVPTAHPRRHCCILSYPVLYAVL